MTPDQIHDAGCVTWGVLCALWARWSFPTYVAIVRGLLERRHEAHLPVQTEVVKTVRDTGGIRYPVEGVWQHERWQVGA